MIKKTLILLITCVLSISISANGFKPLNDLKIREKFSTLMNVEIENIEDLNLYGSLNSWLGTKYVYAGNTKKGVDCSGFTKRIYKKVFGIDLPRVSYLQYKVGEMVKKDSLQEGDLIFFIIKGKRISHVGIYLQNDKFIHASVHNGVTISDLNSPYYKQKYYKACRI